jgi:hypothetical protein
MTSEGCSREIHEDSAKNNHEKVEQAKCVKQVAAGD